MGVKELHCSVLMRTWLLCAMPIRLLPVDKFGGGLRGVAGAIAAQSHLALLKALGEMQTRLLVCHALPVV